MTGDIWVNLQRASWVLAFLSLGVGVISNRDKLSSFFKAHWKKVALILLMGFLCSYYFENLFNFIQKIPSWFSRPVPFWLIPLVLLGAVVLVLVLLAVLLVVWKIRKMPNARQLTYLDYIEDEMFGVIWNWDYHGGRINTDILMAICPRKGCGNQLRPKEDFHRATMQRLTPPVSLTCRNCNFSQPFDSDLEELKGDVAEEIQRRVRTGHFMKVLSEKIARLKSDASSTAHQ
jgi:hypothetical protein